MDKETKKEIESLETRINDNKKESDKLTTQRRAAIDELKAYTGADEGYRSILKKSIQTTNDSIDNINAQIRNSNEQIRLLQVGAQPRSSNTQQNGMLSHEYDFTLLYL